MEVDTIRLLSFFVSVCAMCVWIYWGKVSKKFETTFAFVTVLAHNAVYLFCVEFLDLGHHLYSTWATVLRLHGLLVFLFVGVLLLLNKRR